MAALIPSVGCQITRVQHEGIVTHDAEAAKDVYVRLLGRQVLADAPAAP